MNPIAAVVTSAMLALAACSGAPAQPAAPDARAQLFPSDWKVAEIGGQPVVPGSTPTLAFDAEGRVSGHGSCNRFMGTATLDGDKLTLTPLASTRMACLDEALSRQETAYLQALTAGERIVLNAAGLEIHGDPAGPVRLLR